MTSGAVGGLLTGCAVLFAAAALRVRRDAGLAERLREMEMRRRAGRAGAWGICSRVGAVPIVRRVSVSGSLVRRIELAGWSRPVEAVAGAKVVLALTCGAAALAAPVPVRLLAPIVAVSGYVAPDLAAARASRRRAALADAEIPQFLDLLAAASSAGLSGPLALRRSVEATRGPLAHELDQVIRAVDLGGRWREELRRLAERLGLPDLRRTVAALTRTESLGTSLSEALTELATQVRDARRAATTERARKAPVKMLFPLVFLVLPAFLLLTVVPVLLTTLQSIR